MAWKKGNLAKSKFKRWAKNPQKVNNAPAILHSKTGEDGPTVLYRSHAKGLAFENVTTEDRSKQTYLGLPLTIISILKLYDGKKDEELPPILHTMIVQRKLWQSEKRQGFDNTHCIKVLDSENSEVLAFLEGTRGYYVWYNKQRNFLKKSCVYTAEKMRLQWKQFDGDIFWRFEDRLTWIDVEFLPAPK